MNENIFKDMLNLFSGMLIALLSIYLNDKIKKRDRPEKYQKVIYEQRLIVYKAISLKLCRFVHDLSLYVSKKIDDKKLYNTRMEIISCLHENGLFLSGSLVDVLKPIVYLEQPVNSEISEETFRKVVESFVSAMAIMKKELGFTTIHSKFIEIFPEINSLEK